MTSSKSIIDALLEGKLASVKENTESVLNYKLSNKLQEKYADIAPSVFEAKKAKVTDKDNDSEDDSGETLDPVDKSQLKGKLKDREDKDVDNDGDVDDSDKFLHKKRKAISKAIKKEDKTECPKCKGEGCDHCGGDGYHEDEVDESSAARKAHTRKKGGYKYGTGPKSEPGGAGKGADKEDDVYNRRQSDAEGGEDSLKGGSANIRRHKEMKRRAKERKLKAIADKRKSLAREKEKAEA